MGQRILRKILLGVVIAGIVSILIFTGIAWAGQTFNSDSEEGLLGLEQFDFSEIDEFLNNKEATNTLALESVMKYLMAGNLMGLCREILNALTHALFSEVSTGSRLIGQILALGILGAIFTNFSSVFQNSQI